ncbi:NAD(P)H-binding protein [Halochromatium glycolicum]|nr:NAD(P)H-binding protein [Halochromatium glycolicum]
MAGGTGTIGRATVATLVARGHEVVCLVRPRPGKQAASRPNSEPKHRAPADQVRGVGLPAGVEVRFCEITDPVSLREQGLRNERFDAIVSCLASRTGEPRDAWAIDHQANLSLLQQGKAAGATQMVLLSAICVQRPRLAFQQAKLAFEAALTDSGLTYSIVRATAFFKSLSGQIERVRQGKPYLLFGDGRLTACKPISDRDLAGYLADCLDDATLQNRILPIGGPGPAITPLEQGEFLFDLLGREPRFKQVPVALIKSIAAALGAAGKVIPPLAVKAELARIGHYYATESMLVLDPATGRYDADATPETGQDTLFEYYRRVVEGADTVERGEHAVF